MRWIRSRPSALARAVFVTAAVGAVFVVGWPLDVDIPKRRAPSVVELILEDRIVLGLIRCVLVVAAAFLLYSLLALTWRGRPATQLGPAAADDAVQQLVDAE